MGFVCARLDVLFADNDNIYYIHYKISNRVFKKSFKGISGMFKEIRYLIDQLKYLI